MEFETQDIFGQQEETQQTNDELAKRFQKSTLVLIENNSSVNITLPEKIIDFVLNNDEKKSYIDTKIIEEKHLILMPKRGRHDTNMIVYTKNGTYLFYLRSVSRKDLEEPDSSIVIDDPKVTEILETQRQEAEAKEQETLQMRLKEEAEAKARAEMEARAREEEEEDDDDEDEMTDDLAQLAQLSQLAELSQLQELTKLQELQKLGSIMEMHKMFDMLKLQDLSKLSKLSQLASLSQLSKLSKKKKRKKKKSVDFDSENAQATKTNDAELEANKLESTPEEANDEPKELNFYEHVKPAEENIIEEEAPLQKETVEAEEVEQTASEQTAKKEPKPEKKVKPKPKPKVEKVSQEDDDLYGNY